MIDVQAACMTGSSSVELGLIGFWPRAIDRICGSSLLIPLIFGKDFRSDKIFSMRWCRTNGDNDFTFGKGVGLQICEFEQSIEVKD